MSHVISQLSLKNIWFWLITNIFDIKALFLALTLVQSEMDLGQCSFKLQEQHRRKFTIQNSQQNTLRLEEQTWIWGISPVCIFVETHYNKNLHRNNTGGNSQFSTKYTDIKRTNFLFLKIDPEEFLPVCIFTE